MNVPCQVCGSGYLVVRHHIKTRGSGGTDHQDNTVMLCAYNCHVKIHSMGLVKFCKTFTVMKSILIKKGWEIDPFGKWRRYDND